MMFPLMNTKSHFYMIYMFQYGGEIFEKQQQKGFFLDA